MLRCTLVASPACLIHTYYSDTCDWLTSCGLPRTLHAGPASVMARQSEREPAEARPCRSTGKGNDTRFAAWFINRLVAFRFALCVDLSVFAS